MGSNGNLSYLKMKKQKILILLLGLLLTGCGSFFTSYSSSDSSSTSSSSTTTSVSSTSSSSSSSSSTGHSSSSSASNYVFTGEGQKLLDDMLQDAEEITKIGVGVPSMGTPKILVVPVEFQTYRGFGRFAEGDLDKIQLAFNGTSEQTGFESVSSFYNKSSYGKLDLTFDVLETAFTLSQNFRYYQNDVDNGVAVILEEVLAGLDNEIDYSNYDSNNDGVIDAVCLIYSLPYSGSDNQDIILLEYMDDDFWWAWVDWYPQKHTSNYDGLKVDYYMWASVDFINEPYDCTGTKYIPINAVTYIHETGHLLGLDDYYDYDYQDKNGNAVPSKMIGGLGGADLMDASVGDHGPQSKILLGWIEPKVITSDETIKLVSMQDTPNENEYQVLLIPKEWNDSYFSEYYLVDFYTPTKLNELHKGCWGLFKNKGVRIYHIDATVDHSVGDALNLDVYYTIFSYNNSTSSRLFAKLMEGDGDASLEKFTHTVHGDLPTEASDSDLFYAGQSFGENATWYDGTPVNFTISVDSIVFGVATLSISFK